MAAGNYPDIYFVFEASAGVITPVPASVTVKARTEGAGSDIAESPFTTDADGKVAAGVIASDAPTGSIVHFRIENYLGMAASVAIETT